MFTELQRALAAMALNAYRPTEENDLELQALGWVVISPLSLPNRGDGFDATVFRSATGQIVISFRGTDGSNLIPGAIDLHHDVRIGRGVRSAQAGQAIGSVMSPVMHSQETGSK